MAINYSEFLDAAKELASDGREIGCRNSISRAYYSALHAARVLSKLLPQGPGNINGSHAQLIDQLSECPVGRDRDRAMKMRRVGYLLRQHKLIRNDADYELDLDISPEDAKTSIRYAENIAKIVQEIDPEAAVTAK